MRYLTVLIAFLCIGLAKADDEDLPWTTGLDWSSNGQYIAVATSRGVHIRQSEDLSLHSVLDDKYILTAVWSNQGLDLAYSKSGDPRIAVHSLESGDETYLTFPGLYRQSSTVRLRDSIAQSIVWSPTDEYLAAGRSQQIAVWNVKTQELQKQISLWNLYATELALIDWRPVGGHILSGFLMNGIAIWHYFTGTLVDFISNMDGVNWPARWSPDGNMIAAGSGPVSVWSVNPEFPDRALAEIGGERIHRLDIKSARLFGLSWHPDATKLAFIINHYGENGVDFSKSGALIWDLTSDTTIVLPNAFNLRRGPEDKAIEWSPDGSKLAAMSSDGRVVIWETETYEVIAEYDGYLSLVDIQ